jgi:hypothetical protein
MAVLATRVSWPPEIPRPRPASGWSGHSAAVTPPGPGSGALRAAPDVVDVTSPAS